LYVSVFEGSKDKDNLEIDKEALELWKAIVPKDRIIYGNKADNFWEMGDQGPCGPCSEIHVDIRSKDEKAKIPGAKLVNQDHPEVIEIWNLVFMQYNRKADGSLESLPEKHVDTGMGFERLCMVLQGVHSSYDTDVFTPLVRELELLSGKSYGKDTETDIAIRVVADHVRAVAFSIADGQLPSNNGAGYVIRRILRRAVRYGFTFLATSEPFIYKLVKVLVATMGAAFPELKKQIVLIENVVKEEEHSFLKTLEQGLILLDEIISKTKGKTVVGEKAFELYDTFGFPIDLTSLILSEKGLSLDEAGFNKAMARQKERSRSASEVSKDDWNIVSEKGDQEFLGYDQLKAEVRLVKYRKVISKKEGEQFQLVFDKTPFYPEGGGQVGDKGYLEVPNGDVVYILDTKRENNEIVHFAKNLPKHPEQTLTAVVDEVKRASTERNHSATHLLHQALREILGTHVEQKGSAVHSGHLRFDFSHFSKLTEEEIDRVEKFVNQRIQEKLPLQEERNIPMEKALKEGAIALFGEKYGEQVRTVRFGDSLELCGGTHVSNTADIWHFKIVSEGAIAAGVRRIEAITSYAVRDFYEDKNQQLDEIKSQLKSSGDPVKAVEQLLEENNEMKKEIESLLKDKARSLKRQFKEDLESIDDFYFLAKEVDLDAGAMKDLAFEMGQEEDKLFLLFASSKGGKALLSCYISKDLVASKGWNAGKIVKDLGQYIQGGGGGQPFFATAGGKNPAGIQKALQQVRSLIS
ncbi:MAG: alanine--tRNA ligase, partial [Flavobacteriaceae bacterium]|nr:alanine--tRNA ligase [Flavobacteriaceae bacterium]